MPGRFALAMLPRQNDLSVFSEAVVMMGGVHNMTCLYNT